MQPNGTSDWEVNGDDAGCMSFYCQGDTIFGPSTSSLNSDHCTPRPKVQRPNTLLVHQFKLMSDQHSLLPIAGETADVDIDRGAR